MNLESPEEGWMGSGNRCKVASRVLSTALSMALLLLAPFDNLGWAGAVCHDLWLSPSCGSGACSHHGGVWVWCECPSMDGRDNHVAMCPQSVPVAAAQPAHGSLIGSGLGDVLVETISDNPGVLTPCAQFDEQSRPACRAALLIGGTAIALGVRSMVSSDEEDCQEALVYANQELRQRYRRAGDALPGLENDYLEQQALLKKAVDESGFKTTAYRSLLAELLRDDLKLSSVEVAAFERAHPDVDGGAVAAYRAHRNSPFFDQMLEVFRVGIEIRKTQATIDLIAEVWPLDTSEEAAAESAKSGACEAWIEHRRAALEE